MSGADYLEFGYDMDEWEKMQSEIPPHLLADEDEEEEMKIEYSEKNVIEDRYLKENCWSFLNQKDVVKPLRQTMIIIWALLFSNGRGYANFSSRLSFRFDDTLL